MDGLGDGFKTLLIYDLRIVAADACRAEATRRRVRRP
jgi:hypothetical protein